MRICWDNLEKLKYSKKDGFFRNIRYVIYYFKPNCKYCNKPFLGQNHELFCSISCSRKYSPKLSEETKLKISKTSSGINNGMYGKKHTNKSKHLMSKLKTGTKHTKETKNILRQNMLKDKSPLWKGGYCSKGIPVYDTYSKQLKPIEQTRRNFLDKNILEVKCTYCGKWIIPTINQVTERSRSINYGIDNNRFYCSKNCKNECPIFRQKKFPKGFKLATSREVQPELRQMRMEIDNYICQKCNKQQDDLDVGLHCHHLEGIRWEPIESADIDKVITLCKNCHLEVHKQEGCKYYEYRCPEEDQDIGDNYK